MARVYSDRSVVSITIKIWTTDRENMTGTVLGHLPPIKTNMTSETLLKKQE